ncbi:MAG: glycosyltransferase family 4 protein [Anaerolineales bacterium]|nr:glycosyltransferase family 4 protein [Anaerolineales bacterium]
MDYPVKVLLFANTDWYLYNFRLPLAQALRTAGHEVLLLSPPGEYGPRLVQAGFCWISFPLSRRGMNPFSELITLWRLTRLYSRERPDLAHHFTVKCVLYGSLAAKMAGVKGIVNAITGLGYVFIGDEPPVRLLRWLIKGFYRCALRGSQVIFQNPEDQSLFSRNGLVDGEQVTMIPSSGVDIEKFSPSPEPAGEPLVILPARMLWAKGVAEFVDAARLLREDGIHARFALVGDTDLANPDAVPVDQLEKWQKEGIIEWWGWQEDMPAIYRQTHIVCLPSYREGTPKTLIEAAACGRPIVTTDVPGCRLVTHHQQNGLLVPVRDSRALAEALKILIADSALRKQMGKKGRELAVAEFSLEKVVGQTLAVYEKTLSGYRKG